MSKTYPTKELVRETLLFANKSYSLLAEEVGVCPAVLMSVIDMKNYQFKTYQKAIEYCRKLIPEKDWTYPSLEELVLFFQNNKVPRGMGTNKKQIDYFLTSKLNPNINTYTLLCNIKSKMEAENLCSK